MVIKVGTGEIDDLSTLTILNEENLLRELRARYKKGIIYGLMLSVVGAVLMILAVNFSGFAAILSALFVVALGFSLQQTAAQPFAIELGDPATGTAAAVPEARPSTRARPRTRSRPRTHPGCARGACSRPRERRLRRATRISEHRS